MSNHESREIKQLNFERSARLKTLRNFITFRCAVCLQPNPFTIKFGIFLLLEKMYQIFKSGMTVAFLSYPEQGI